MKYQFILNPISGGGKNSPKIINFVKKYFNTYHSYKLVYTSYAGEAKILAEQAVADGFDIVVAAGGDGTVNEVASGLVGTGAALGIIPTGSGNGLARSYGIPLNISDSIKFMANPNIATVDAGKVGEHYFFGVCGLGFDAVVGQKFQEFGKRGPLPYFFIGIREYIQYKPENITLIFNNQEVNVSPLLITISNTKQYGNGAIISPNANPQDGVFEICIIDMLSFVKAVSSLRKMFNATIDTIPEYTQYRTNSLKIVFENENGIIHTDGEPHTCSKITEIKVLDKALNVCSNL